ncbi:aromatic ring-hydroxylating dioxygenase subunit alpha [Streptomyces sp. NPDC091215]|uniref:aromatic ring-hydroxylating oxygenase subunit alpha n=1 Tax=Streptomyces sp. NPDC091215 TaxID=3155192 RepID=UPI0034362A17
MTPTVRPPGTAEALPREAYVSQENFERELERVFYSTWQYAGHVSELPAAGSFKRFAVGAADVLVVRAADGRINALHNVCRHRGSQLVSDDTGTCKRALTCHYHGWAYNHDGSLRGAPRMGDGFDKHQFGLRRAHIEIWNGCIFVHLGDGTPVPVRESLADVVWPYADLDRAKVAEIATYEVETNWKICWENALECYHCAINHPELVRVFDQDGDAGGADGGADYVYFVNPLLGDSLSVTRSGHLESKVLFECTTPVDEARGFFQWHTSTFEMVGSPDCIAVTSYTPLAPDRTRITQTFLVPEKAAAGKDYEPAVLFELHKLAREQDNQLCTSVQRGVRNPAYVPGPFNDIYEVENLRFLDVYWKLMADGPERA